MGIDKEFESLIFRLYKQNSEEVFSFDYNGQKYWLKKARATKSNFIHRLFYKLFSFEVLLPVENKSKEETLGFETKKIECFNEKGIKTPKIFFKNSDFFILEDCGKMVNSYIRKRDITSEKMYYYIDLMLKELSLIHNQNEYHGGAQARNFIYKDGVISTIDLEDSFDKNISLDILQFRDLTLFLLSLTKTRGSFELDYEFIIDKYLEYCPQNKSYKKRLKEMASKISFFTKISQINFINKFIGRDGKGFFKLFQALQNLK